MSYDNYKLSNPIDDGFYKEVVSSCCGAEIGEGNISNCCGSKIYDDTDICVECKEHADRDDECCLECGDACDEMDKHEYDEMRRDSYREMMRDER